MVGNRHKVKLFKFTYFSWSLPFVDKITGITVKVINVPLIVVRIKIINTRYCSIRLNQQDNNLKQN